MSWEDAASVSFLKGGQNLGQRLSASLLPRRQAHREAAVVASLLV
jgi:hypothetical protein